MILAGDLSNESLRQRKSSTANWLASTNGNVSASASGVEEERTTGFHYGLSVNVGATFIWGYSLEIGIMLDKNGNILLFKSSGKTMGIGGSVGINAFLMPSSDFQPSMMTQYNSADIWTPIPISLFGDYYHGAVNEEFGKKYISLKLTISPIKSFLGGVYYSSSPIFYQYNYQISPMQNLYNILKK
jgi:hypothetical protein